MTLIKDGRERKLNTLWNCLVSSIATIDGQKASSLSLGVFGPNFLDWFLLPPLFLD